MAAVGSPVSLQSADALALTEHASAGDAVHADDLRRCGIAGGPEVADDRRSADPELLGDPADRMPLPNSCPDEALSPSSAPCA
jgi:hypothetical protein